MVVTGRFKPILRDSVYNCCCLITGCSAVSKMAKSNSRKGLCVRMSVFPGVGGRLKTRRKKWIEVGKRGSVGCEE